MAFRATRFVLPSQQLAIQRRRTSNKQEAIAFCRHKETFNISEDIAFSVQVDQLAEPAVIPSFDWSYIFKPNTTIYGDLNFFILEPSSV
jgi:hypothetical protein